jgi:hypothetical protein
LEGVLRHPHGTTDVICGLIGPHPLRGAGQVLEDSIARRHSQVILLDQSIPTGGKTNHAWNIRSSSVEQLTTVVGVFPPLLFGSCSKAILVSNKKMDWPREKNHHEEGPFGKKNPPAAARPSLTGTRS